MTPAEIENTIKEMGYIIVTPKAIKPSYYRLNDGTVIEARVHVNFGLVDPQNADGLGFSTTNLTSAYVPAALRRPQEFRAFNPGEINSAIIEEDVPFTVLQEDFTVYDLSNNSTLSIKTVVAQIKRTRFFTPEGEPVFSVVMNPIAKIIKNKAQ